VQAFEPNNPRFYPIYSECVKFGIPITFHTGSTYWGAGLKGGGRVKLRFSDPMLLDDVATDFPELKIIMAHPGWPWQDEQLAVAMHKENVYIDLSGWSPKYFQPLLVTYMTKMIPHKFLFGTDYPMLSPPGYETSTRLTSAARSGKWFSERTRSDYSRSVDA
jgi:predicted TIM-barrel fold metal-dependent hydrolase